MARMHRLVACLLALTACSSTTHVGGGSGAVNGTVAGNSLAPSDTVAIIGSQNSSGVNVQYAAIVLSDVGAMCTRLTNHQAAPNGTGLALVVGTSAALVQPGTYTINAHGAETATAEFAKVDAKCQSTLMDAATGGTVTITTFSTSEVSGAFQLTFPDGSLSGSFDAPACPGLSLEALTGTSCQQ
jgi:hypothetical protein